MISSVIILTNGAPFSPVDELIKTQKVIKTGIGGIPSKQAFRKEQRAIHPSYKGNISAHSTGSYEPLYIVMYTEQFCEFRGNL